MKINDLKAQLPILCGLALLLAGAVRTPTTDAPAVPASDVEIERSADELRTDVADALRHDVDTTNIALVFNAPGAITNLDADQAHVAGMTRIRFPVVAAY